MAKKARADLLDDLEARYRKLQHSSDAAAGINEPRSFREKENLLEELLAEYRKEVHALRRENQQFASAVESKAGRKADDSLDKLLDNSLDLFFRLNRRNAVVWMSSAFSTRLGFDVARRTGRPVRDLLHADDRHAAKKSLDSARLSKTPAGGTWIWRHQNGTSVPLETWCTADEEGSILALARDSCQPKAFADSPARPHSGWQTSPPDQLATTSKSSAISANTRPAHFDQIDAMHHWISALVHEIKQPLTAVLAYTQGSLRLLQSGVDDRAEVIEALRQATLQAVRAGDILHSMRRLTEAGNDQRTRTALNDMIQKAVDPMRELCRDNDVEVALDLTEEPTWIRADDVQMIQVLQNLIRNALEAMEAVAKSTASKRQLTIQTTAHEQEIEVAIRDTGTGLSVEQVRRLFEPYHTTKHHGMGLGLALCRAIIQAHGGRIWAKPNSDQGTSFHLALPKTV